jgi:hypothetical protein
LNKSASTNFPSFEAQWSHNYFRIQYDEEQSQLTIRPDKPREAEDLHLQQIFLVFFSFLPIYPQQGCKRTATPAKTIASTSLVFKQYHKMLSAKITHIQKNEEHSYKNNNHFSSLEEISSIKLHYKGSPSPSSIPVVLSTEKSKLTLGPNLDFDISVQVTSLKKLALTRSTK